MRFPRLVLLSLPFLAVPGKILPAQSFQLIATETPPNQGYWQPVERYLFTGSGSAPRKLSFIPSKMTHDPSCAAFRTPFELFVANRASHSGKGYISTFVMSSDGKDFVQGPPIRGNGLTDPHQIAFNPVDGELFCTNYKSGIVSRFTFDKFGRPVPNGTITMPDKKIMVGLAVRKKDQQLFVSHYTFVRRFRRNANGTYAYAGALSVQNKNGLHYMTFLGDELYLCAVFMDKIYRFSFDAQGNPVKKKSITSPSPISVAFSLDGKEMFAASHYAGGIRRYQYDASRDDWVYKSTILTPKLGGLAVGPVDGSGSFSLYGTGCPGTGKAVPTVSAVGSAFRGKALTVRVHRGLPKGSGVLLLGTLPAALPLPGGCSLLVGGTLYPFFVSLDQEGSYWMPIQVPAALYPGDAFFQFFGVDPGAPNGMFSSSNGLKVHVM